MHKHSAGTGFLGRLHRSPLLGGAIGIMLLGLVGCADTSWERAVYQSVTSSNEQCRLKRRPADAPCAELLDYESYERERARARNQASPSSRVNPIEEERQ